MQSATQAVPVSKTGLWTGRVISTLVVLLLLLDSFGKFAKPPQVLDAFIHLGLPQNLTTIIGVLLLVCTVAYAIPRTAILGAILLTGYLGGAVAIHLRAGDPAFPLVFPALFGAVAWTGLYLRDRRLRTLIPLNG
jgi:hypothetical protein